MANTIILIAIYSLFVIAWLAFVVHKYLKWHRKYKNCVQECQVKVIDVLEQRYKSKLEHKPIFRPLDPMNETVIDTAFYTYLHEFEVGQTLVLLVNPNNIKEFLYKDNKYNSGKKFDILACVFAGIFIFVMILLSYNKW